MNNEPPPFTKAEKIATFIAALIFLAVMGGIFYLAATSPPSDNSHMMMDMMP